MEENQTYYFRKYKKKEKKMELRIINPTEDGFVQEIEWNHEEIKAEVAEKMKEYASMVYTKDQIKEAKSDRAKLNKFVKALEAKSKEIKKQCMAPYEDFETKMKEIIMIVNEPIALIDEQLRDYDEQKKAEKRKQIEELFQTLPKIDGFEDLELYQIWNEKWLNTTVSMKKVTDEINAALEEIKGNMEMLQKLPEYSFEALKVYRDTLDVKRAVGEAQMMSEVQKEKAAYEAKRRKEEQQKLAVASEEIPGQASFSNPESFDSYTNQVMPSKEKTKEWVKFQAYMTVDDALALKRFFEARNIEFKAI